MAPTGAPANCLVRYARLSFAANHRSISIHRQEVPMAAVLDFTAANDPDAFETKEWLDALEAVIEREGPERAHFLLEKLIDQARRSGAYIPFSPNTAYINTIPPHLETPSPGDPALEERIRSYVRWNAMATVVRANRGEGDLGGHIASYASVGTMMEVGFNHFWRAPTAEF